jgi:hypothetical protein
MGKPEDYKCFIYEFLLSEISTWSLINFTWDCNAWNIFRMKMHPENLRVPDFIFVPTIHTFSFDINDLFSDRNSHFTLFCWNPNNHLLLKNQIEMLACGVVFLEQIFLYYFNNVTRQIVHLNDEKFVKRNFFTCWIEEMHTSRITHHHTIMLMTPCVQDLFLDFWLFLILMQYLI